MTLAAPLFAQSDAPAAPPSPDEITAALPLDQRFPTLLNRGRYLEAFEQVEAADPAQINDGLRATYRQMRPMLDGFFYVDPAAPALPPPNAADVAAYDGAVAIEAIEAILAHVGDRRIVIVNEAHDSPRDRAFILKLAEALKPIGFTHYAAETFTNYPADISAAAISRLQALGYPARNTGFYTEDPMFAYLVRRALALGYQPVAYEAGFSPEFRAAAPDQQIMLREQTQAENLARAIAAAGPDAKFLIHVGYGHAAERPMPPGETEWMAARLARLTGLDPLTIDQTAVSEVSFPPQSRALHAALTPRLGGASRVFVSRDEPLVTGWLGGAVDLQAVHPRVEAVAGRPDWLRATGREATVIPAALLPTQGRRLVQAFVAGEAEDAVPLDQALVVAGREPPVLYVPTGTDIRWAVQD